MADTRVVVDCSLPDKAAAAAVTAAEIAAILNAEQDGGISAAEADARIATLRQHAATVAALPDQVTIVELTDAEQKQRDQDLADHRDRTLADLRAARTTLLRESDWTALADNPLTDNERAAWATYRQKLRDFPDRITDPLDPPKWPTPPG